MIFHFAQHSDANNYALAPWISVSNDTYSESMSYQESNNS